MKISLVIPMYNESSIIEQAVSTFSSYMEKRFEDWELIFVDDGSADGCGDAVATAHEKDARIRLCRYTPNRGKGYAVRTGVLAAEGDLILFTDCDNWPHYVEALLPHTHDGTALLIKGIYRSKASREAWKQLIARTDVRVTFDLYDFGICFFEKRLNKENFTINYY